MIKQGKVKDMYEKPLIYCVMMRNCILEGSGEKEEGPFEPFIPEDI